MKPSDRSDPSDKSTRSDSPGRSDDLFRLLPKHGGYRKLRSFHAAVAIFDATLIFCNRFISPRSRTHDQMVQAARSGVQNIVEGSVASGTSKKTELKLTNVARASLEELMRDYEDFLRQNGLRRWDKDSPEALAVRRRFQSDSSDLSEVHTAAPEVAANALLCLINQASYLLHRQLERLERDFLDNGGFTERLYTARTQAREKRASSDTSDKSDPSTQSKTPAPDCPLCGHPMRLRAARKGARAGTRFWGCSTFPACKGTRPTST